MTDVIDINTRKKKKLRGKNKVKAQRWDGFMKWIDSGLITITVAGTVLNKDEMEALAETIDAEVKEEQKLVNKERVRKSRSKKKIDTD